MDDDNNANDDFSYTATTTNTFYNLNSGVSQGTTYKFRIVARNQIGTSPQSPTGSDLAASVPAQVSSPSKVTADTTSIVVAWTSVDDRGSAVLNYEVYWDAGSGVTPRTLLTTTSNDVRQASSTLAEQDLIDGRAY